MTSSLRDVVYGRSSMCESPVAVLLSLNARPVANGELGVKPQSKPESSTYQKMFFYPMTFTEPNQLRKLLSLLQYLERFRTFSSAC